MDLRKLLLFYHKFLAYSHFTVVDGNKINTRNKSVVAQSFVLRIDELHVRVDDFVAHNVAYFYFRA